MPRNLAFEARNRSFGEALNVTPERFIRRLEIGRLLKKNGCSPVVSLVL